MRRDALRMLYNSAFRMLLSLPRFRSASGMFTKAQVDGFHAVMCKKASFFLRRMRGSHNSILKTITARLDGSIQKHWRETITGQINYYITN